MSIVVRELSRVLVEVHEDAKRTHKVRRDLVEKLERTGVPVTRSEQPLPVDIIWTVDGQPCMFDIKTPADVIASVADGRLHSQLAAMEAKGCLLHGFIIEGKDSEDGVTVGYGSHAWPVERYDNLLLSVQCEGAKVVRSTSPARTARRIAELYRYSGKADRGSWRAPMKPHYTHNRMYGDEAFRRAVEGLMSLFPGCGEQRANDLLDRLTVREVLSDSGERWITVPGVGPKLCAVWRGILEGDFRVGNGNE